jgi:hypothetical protein
MYAQMVISIKVLARLPPLAVIVKKNAMHGEHQCSSRSSRRKKIEKKSAKKEKHPFIFLFISCCRL